VSSAEGTSAAGGVDASAESETCVAAGLEARVAAVVAIGVVVRDAVATGG